MADPSTDLQAVVATIAFRVTEIERRLAHMAAGALGAGAATWRDGGASDADRQARERVAAAEREAQAILEAARAESRALVETVRRSLDDAVRRKDEEVLAAVGESHERVLAVVEEQLRAGGPRL